ncbi:MAG: DoxX family protein [Bacteroidia bacterium]|nr:MAG: DoxX family protein [Bacteroidia bacterium]
MKIIIKICRIIIGLLFAFSGFVKAVDPVGTQIKFEDYFHAMGLDFLAPYALFFSFLMNAAELSIGIMLIFNIFPKRNTQAAFLLMLLFTPLTLWLAVAEPVSDCGCFGDAVKLTNWQTFGKNVIFLSIIILLLIFRKLNTSRTSLKTSIFAGAIIIFSAFIFQTYNYLNLPVIDFRPFKTGTDIEAASSIPEGAKTDEYKTVLYYKNLKTGEKQKFDIENIPYEDTLTWAYDTTITELISKGYEPPIHDFVLNNLSGEDLTQEILKPKGTKFILIMRKLDDAYADLGEKTKEISDFCAEKDIPLYGFTASDSETIRRTQNALPGNLILCTGDKKMLKTMIRSNAGLIILKDAVLTHKFHHRNIPSKKELHSL